MAYLFGMHTHSRTHTCTHIHALFLLPSLPLSFSLRGLHAFVSTHLFRKDSLISLCLFLYLSISIHCLILEQSFHSPRTCPHTNTHIPLISTTRTFSFTILPFSLTHVQRLTLASTLTSSHRTVRSLSLFLPLFHLTH